MYSRPNSLMHYGVLGMKWGKRRAQNKLDRYNHRAQNKPDAYKKVIAEQTKKVEQKTQALNDYKSLGRKDRYKVQEMNLIGGRKAADAYSHVLATIRDKKVRDVYAKQAKAKAVSRNVLGVIGGVAIGTIAKTAWKYRWVWNPTE